MRTLSDGRERRSREEWREIVAGFRRSGLSENRFCRERRLRRKTFRTWRKHFADGPPRDTAFVELAVPGPAVEAMRAELGSGTFELCLPGGVTLRWRA